MRIRNFLYLACALLMLAAQSDASGEREIMPPENIRQQIDEYTTEYFAEIHGREKIGTDIVISVGDLDPRLKLSKCDQPLTLTLNRPSQQVANMTIRAACTGEVRWSLYVPVSVDIYDYVAMAARSMNRGSVISEDDLTFQRINTSRFGSGQVKDAERLVGMETTRAINAGEVIKVSHVRPANVIAKGDAVVLEASSTAISVAVTGTALENGHVGKQIRVRNEQSSRVVEAVVTGPGRASVRL